MKISVTKAVSAVFFLALTGCATADRMQQSLNAEPQSVAHPNLAIARDMLPSYAALTYSFNLRNASDCVLPESVAESLRDSQNKKNRKDDKSGALHSNSSDSGVTAPTNKTQMMQKCLGLDPITNMRTASNDYIEDRALQTKYNTYLDQSIFITNAYCEAYLESLSNLGDASRFTKNEVNLLVNTASVLMALGSDSNAKSMGLLNAGSHLYNSTHDNLENFMLFGPSPSKLTQLVRTSMKAKIQDLQDVRNTARTQGYLEWSLINAWAQEYATQCTPRGMRILMDKAIDSDTKVISKNDTDRSYNELGASLKDVLKAKSEEALRNDPNITPLPNLDITDPIRLSYVVWFVKHHERGDQGTTQQLKDLDLLKSPKNCTDNTSSICQIVTEVNYDYLLALSSLLDISMPEEKVGGKVKKAAFNPGEDLKAYLMGSYLTAGLYQQLNTDAEGRIKSKVDAINLAKERSDTNNKIVSVCADNPKYKESSACLTFEKEIIKLLQERAAAVPPPAEAADADQGGAEKANTTTSTAQDAPA